MSRTAPITAGLLLAAIVALPGSAGAEDPVLRIGSVAPTGTPWSALLERAEKRIESESGKRIDVKLYLGGKLGSEGSLVRRCQKGQVGGIAVSTGAIGQAVPELYATELPYLYESYEQADRSLDAAKPLVSELLDAQGFVFYMWGENGFRHFASKKKFFLAPGDLKGMEMRAQPAMPHVEMYKALGAGAQTIAVGEVVSALANDVVTGYDNTLLYAYATQWHKEVKYVTLSSHIYQGAIVVWCKPWFDTLPDDLKAILRKVPPGEEKTGRVAVRAMNQRLEAQFKEAGLELKAHGAAERAAFKKATAVVRDRFLASATAKGKELLSLLEKNR